MSIVFHVLEEELQRLQKLQHNYQRQIHRLPNGSLSLKKRYNKIYAYLAYRVGDKVKFNYLGDPKSAKVKDLKDQLSRKKEVLQKLSMVNKDLKQISGLLRARKI